MCLFIRHTHLTRVITCGLVVFCCIPASAAAQAHGVRDLGAPGSANGLVIGIDTSERGVGYVYRGYSAVEHTTMVSTTGRANTDTGVPGGAYSYTRDTDNHLWWAVPY